MLKAATLSVTIITREENKIAFTRYIYIMDHSLVIERNTIIQFGWISRVLYYVKKLFKMLSLYEMITYLKKNNSYGVY